MGGYNWCYTFKEGKFIACSAVPMATTFDGPIIRHSAAWALMVTRSNNVMINHAKILNSLSLGEVCYVRLFICQNLNTWSDLSLPMGWTPNS